MAATLKAGVGCGMRPPRPIHRETECSDGSRRGGTAVSTLTR
jgi:hypothetical protein